MNGLSLSNTPIERTKILTLNTYKLPLRRANKPITKGPAITTAARADNCKTTSKFILFPSNHELDVA
jgi:hypothetical protein